MKQLLFKYIADDSGFALHDKAVAHSPSKLEVSGPPHAKLLQGPKLSFPDWQHPKEAFLQGMNYCDSTPSMIGGGGGGGGGCILCSSSFLWLYCVLKQLDMLG